MAPRDRKRRRRVPWWLLAILLCGLLVLWAIVSDEGYASIFVALSGGVATTLWVTFVAFALAALLGLLVALARTSRFRALEEVATFYTEVVRGMPVLVVLFYIAFVAAPWLVEAINVLLTPLIAAGGRPIQHPLAGFHLAGNPGPDDLLFGLHRRGVPGGDRVRTARPDRSGDVARSVTVGDLPPSSGAAGVAHHPAAARQRFRRHDQGFGTGLGAGRAGHHPNSARSTHPAPSGSSKPTMSWRSSTSP